MRLLGEGPRHVFRRHQTAAVEGILDLPDRVRVLGRAQGSPAVLQRTLHPAKWTDVDAGEGGDDRLVDEEGCDSRLEDSARVDLALPC